MDRYSSDYLQVSATILLAYMDHVCSCVLNYSEQLRDIQHAKKWELLSIRDSRFLTETLESTVNDITTFTKIVQNFSDQLIEFYNAKYVSPLIYSEILEREIFEKEKIFLSEISLSGKKNSIFISKQAE